MLIPRNLKSILIEDAQTMRVLLVNGARQTGKSTLMKGLFEAGDRPAYVTLDDLTSLAAARLAPKSFVERFTGPVIIDEIQRAPELFLPIKEVVDRRRKPGQFFLTGSANVLTLPKLADSLAGRMGIYTLEPLSQGEIAGVQESFIDDLFGPDKLEVGKVAPPAKLLKSIVYGGYPDAVKLESVRQRNLWYRSYVTTILERDVRELSDIEGLASLPDLLKLVASRAGGLLNSADLSRSLQLTSSTLKRYLTLLEAVYVIVPLRAWSINLGKRLTKAPKMYLNDTGLLCHLQGVDEKHLASNRTQFGPIFENFVVMELIKQIGWSESHPDIYHFRTAVGQEVDIVLEARGQIVGIECKASSSVHAGDFAGLRILQELAGDRFHRGIILYSGSQIVSFADKLQCIPISALWTSSKPAPQLIEPPSEEDF